MTSRQAPPIRSRHLFRRTGLLVHTAADPASPAAPRVAPRAGGLRPVPSVADYLTVPEYSPALPPSSLRVASFQSVFSLLASFSASVGSLPLSFWQRGFTLSIASSDTLPTAPAFGRLLPSGVSWRGVSPMPAFSRPLPVSSSFSYSTATPNHALQRTAPRVTVAAISSSHPSRPSVALSYVRSLSLRPTTQLPRHAPPSLSLGSLGVARVFPQ